MCLFCGAKGIGGHYVWVQCPSESCWLRDQPLNPIPAVFTSVPRNKGQAVFECRPHTASWLYSRSWFFVVVSTGWRGAGLPPAVPRVTSFNQSPSPAPCLHSSKRGRSSSLPLLSPSARLCVFVERASLKLGCCSSLSTGLLASQHPARS